VANGEEVKKQSSNILADKSELEGPQPKREGNIKLCVQTVVQKSVD
jgi:hypothetical protein